MSINEYREKIEEIKKILLYAHECVDESLCRIDGGIDTVNGQEMTFSHLDILCARDHVKMVADLIFEVATAKIEYQ